MTTAVGSPWEVFRAHLQSDGMFFFLQAATSLAFEAGERDIVKFDNEIQLPEWREHYLYATLVQIEAGKGRLFTPVLTDPEVWKEISPYLEEAFSAEPHRNRRTSAHLALDNGSVVEFLWCRVRVGKRQESPHCRVEYREEDEGHLVVVQRRHLDDAVNQVRRKLERLLREGNRAHIIRIAKFTGIPIPGDKEAYR